MAQSCENKTHVTLRNCRPLGVSCMKHIWRGRYTRLQVGNVIQPEAHVEAGQGETEVFIRSVLYDGKEVLTVSFLRKFLNYCKMVCQPDLTQDAVDSMAEFYRDTRQRSQQPGSHLPLKLLEACIRLATAHAKLKLHTSVTKEDVDVAKAMILSSRNQVEP